MWRCRSIYPTPQAFLEAFEVELSNGGLIVRGSQPEPGVTRCEIDLVLGDALLGTVEGTVERVGRIGTSVRIEALPPEITAAAERLRSGQTTAAAPLQAASTEASPTPPPEGTVADRVARLRLAEKIQLARAGEREERLALLKDSNKTLHVHVLKNPRITLDEVIFAAKLPTLAPEAFELMAGVATWVNDVRLRTAIVRNPAAPPPVALRLLPGLPKNELRAIAHGGARDALVHAARKLLAE